MFELAAVNIRHLQIFLTVSAMGSFSRAANKIGMSQPAVSRIMRDLEASLDVRLFERTGRGVRLSAAGVEIREHAARIAEEYAKLQAVAESAKGDYVGEIKVAIPLRIGNLILAPLLNAFYSRFSKAAIHIFEHLNAEIQEELLAQTTDIGLFYLPPRPSGLVYEEIGREALYAIGRPDMFRAEAETIPMAACASFPLIVQSRPAHYRLMIERAFQEAGHTIRVARELETLDAHVSFAAAGEGITILPFSSVWKEVESGTLVARRIVDPSIWRSLGLATSSRAPSPLVRETLVLLRSILDANRERARWLQPE